MIFHKIVGIGKDERSQINLAGGGRGGGVSIMFGYMII